MRLRANLNRKPAKVWDENSIALCSRAALLEFDADRGIRLCLTRTGDGRDSLTEMTEVRVAFALDCRAHEGVAHVTRMGGIIRDVV